MSNDKRKISTTGDISEKGGWPKIDKSKRWIEEYAILWGEDIEELMSAAKKWVESEIFYYGNGNIGNDGIFDKFDDGTTLNPEFWYHYEIVTGTKVPEDRKKNFFTCGC